MEKKCAAVIVAAGSAQRMQGIDKMLAPLLGVPVLLRSFRALAANETIQEIYIVTRQDLIETVTALCAGEKKFAGAVCGGSSRALSVLNGLREVSQELVAIHDGARPLVSEEIIQSTLQAAQCRGAAAPAIPVRDTVKIARDGLVQQTPDRSSLFAVQTPQIFHTKLIRSALEQALETGVLLTDDCSAAEAAGHAVFLTQGSDENLKITVPTDLILAEAILKEREA